MTLALATTLTGISFLSFYPHEAEAMPNNEYANLPPHKAYLMVKGASLVELANLMYRLTLQQLEYIVDMLGDGEKKDQLNNYFNYLSTKN